MTQINLPFKVNDIVEIRSFQGGYRGAWWRCKILRMSMRNGNLHYKSAFLDYINENVVATHLTKVYQKLGRKVHLMVRPEYPPHYHENEVLKIKSDKKPLVAIHDSWKVGDFVDWFHEGCYWSGTVLELKENGALQVELTPPPAGQGKTYEVLCKDLRPSLEWTPDGGWKLPSMDDQNGQCAKLVRRENEDVCETGKEQIEISTQQETEIATQQETEIATQHQSEIAIQQAIESATKQMEINYDFRLNIMESESIEAAVCDLEEIVVRLKWLGGLLSRDVGECSKTI